MRYLISGILILMFALSGQTQPIQVHPQNPHYFMYKNKPMILVTSAEHYGAVVNLDFDYVTYLNTLAKDGLNYTRIFVGSYYEKPGAFGIEKNTLAPKPDRVVIPWARSNTPGYAHGGNKFDLNDWDFEYFKRLKSFLAEAGKRDIIVEVTLFSSIYSDENWSINPLNPVNNINSTDSVDRKVVHTLNSGNLLGYQEKMVRKIVREVNEFDNLFFEIQNEPWADNKKTVTIINPFLVPENMKQPGWHWKNKVDVANNAALEWQKHVAKWIGNEEKKLPAKHLIAQNYCNFKYPIGKVEPNISIMNFHYAYPEAVTYNYGYNRIINFDESGFAGSSNDTYRKQAWKFMLAGGGVFNNLDYSFTIDCEDGTDTNHAPGGGSVELRRQLKVLKDFLESFDFVKMTPNSHVIKLAPGAYPYVLVEDGKQYAVYLEGGSQCDLVIALGKGKYHAEWINTKTGAVKKFEQFTIDSMEKILSSPAYDGEIALRIIRVS